MNWLLILVILILAGNIVWGFCKGFLRVIYSMLAWIAILIFVTWTTPYVAELLVQNTNIDNRIEEGCNDRLHNFFAGDTQEGSDEASEEKETPNEESYQRLQMKLPDAVIQKLFHTNHIADYLMEETGAYDMVAGRATDMAMQVIAFVLVLLIALISFHLLSVILKVVEKLPVIGEVNHILGLAAGLVKGCLIIWLAFAIIAMAATTEIGTSLVTYIYESPLLVWIYENNFVLTLLVTFL